MATLQIFLAGGLCGVVVGALVTMWLDAWFR